MATEIYLVKVGMTMTEGMVEEWYVPDGGTVKQGDLLYRLETEKINLDVDADATGIVRHGVAVGVTMNQATSSATSMHPARAIPSAGPSAPAAAARRPQRRPLQNRPRRPLPRHARRTDA